MGENHAQRSLLGNGEEGTLPKGLTGRELSAELLLVAPKGTVPA